MYQNGQSTNELIEVMKGILWQDELDEDGNKTGELEPSDQLIIADGAEDRLIDDIRDAGFNIYEAAKGPGSIRAGIKKMLNYRIIVDPGSDNTKSELNNYAWHDKKSQTPIDKHNHIIDAVRYALERLSEGEADFF